MSFLWGKSCKVCGKTANEGDYCQGCYDRKFPVCEQCKRPIRDGEEKVGNCHRKPCYSEKTGKCCECNDKAVKGSYCKSCHHSNYPPPATVEYSNKGANLQIRVDQKTIDSAMYSLGRGITDGRQQSSKLLDMMSLSETTTMASLEDMATYVNNRRKYSFLFNSQ